MSNLLECVEIAFVRSKLPESSCAYCPAEKESIRRDFELIIGNPDCLMVGCFIDDNLIGILG